MYITSCSVRGFRDLTAWSATGLGRVVTVRGPGPGATALGDALDLVFAALDADHLARLLARWGLLAPDETPEVIGDPFPEQATWTDRHAARDLLEEQGDRSVTVEIGLALDPPVFGELRTLAARNPRLVTALSQGAEVHLEATALFAGSYDAMALSLRSFSVGNERFSPTSGDRPAWLDRVLRAIAGRFVRCADRPAEELAAEVLDAATSRERWVAFQAWRDNLRTLGVEARAARGPGDRPLLLADGLPIRRLGRPALDRANVVAAACLGGADMLWADLPEAWAESWTESLVEGSASALEQVWRVCPAGTLVPESQPPEPTGKVLTTR